MSGETASNRSSPSYTTRFSVTYVAVPQWMRPAMSSPMSCSRCGVVSTMCPRVPPCPGPTGSPNGRWNHRRAASRHLRLVERLETEPPPARDDDPARQLEDPELAAALASLPVADQEILRLWAWEQLEPREIAMALGSTSNAVSCVSAEPGGSSPTR